MWPDWLQVPGKRPNRPSEGSRKLATTNPIESYLSTVQRVERNVKRWREGNQPLRWTATGLLEAEKHFRRIKGYQEMLLLELTSEPARHSAEGGQKNGSRLNLVAGRLRVPNIESRCYQLKLGHPLGEEGKVPSFTFALNRARIL